MSRKREVWRPVGEERMDHGAAKGKQGMPTPFGINSGPGSGAGGMGGQAFGPRYSSRGTLNGPTSGGSGASGPGGRGGYQRRPQGYGRASYVAPYAAGPSVFYGDPGYGMDRPQYMQQQQYHPYIQPRYMQDPRNAKGNFAAERRDGAPRGQDNQGGSRGERHGSEHGSRAQTEVGERSGDAPWPEENSTHVENGQLQADETKAEGSQLQQQGQQAQQGVSEQGGERGGESAKVDAQQWQQEGEDPESGQESQPQSLQQLHMHMAQLAANSSPTHGRWGDADSPLAPNTGSQQQEQEQEQEQQQKLEALDSRLASSHTPAPGAGAEKAADDAETVETPKVQHKLSSRAASPEVMSGDAGSSASRSGRESPRAGAHERMVYSNEAMNGQTPAEWAQLQETSYADQQQPNAGGSGNPSQQRAGEVGPTSTPNSVVTSGASTAEPGILNAVLEQESLQGGQQLQLVAAYGDVPDEELLRLASIAAQARVQAHREEAERAAVYLARREIRRAQASLDEARSELGRREAELQARCQEAEQRTQLSEEAARQLKEQAESLEKELHAHRQEVEEKVWQTEGQLQEKASEAAALRKERDGALAESKAQATQQEAERVELRARIQELEAQVGAKERQLQDVSEQLRSAQEELWRKEESNAQQAQSWAAHGQDLEAHAAAMASVNQSLHSELRERTEQCSHLFVANQQMRQQLVDSEQYHLNLIQQLQRELAELRGQPYKPQQQNGRSGSQDHEGMQQDTTSRGTGMEGAGGPQAGNLPQQELQGAAPPFVPGANSMPHAQQDGTAAISAPIPLRPIGPPYGVSGGPPAVGASPLPPVAPASQPSSFIGFPPGEYGDAGSVNPPVRPAFPPGIQPFGMRPVGIPLVHPGALGTRFANGMHGAPGDRPVGGFAPDSGARPPSNTGDSSIGVNSEGTPGVGTQDRGSESATRAVHAQGTQWPQGTADAPPGGSFSGQLPVPLMMQQTGLGPQQGAPGFMGFGVPPPGMVAPPPPGMSLPIPSKVIAAAASPVPPPPALTPGPGNMPTSDPSPRPPDVGPQVAPVVANGISVPPGFGPALMSSAGPAQGQGQDSTGGAGQPSMFQQAAGGTDDIQSTTGVRYTQSADGKIDGLQGTANNEGAAFAPESQRPDSAGNTSSETEQAGEQHSKAGKGASNGSEYGVGLSSGVTQLAQGQSPKDGAAPQMNREPSASKQQQAATSQQHAAVQDTALAETFPKVASTPDAGNQPQVPAALPNGTSRVLQNFMDERSLLTCLVRTLSPGQGVKLQISTTVSNRLARLLAPLSWNDYMPRYGPLSQFIASHAELFIMYGPDYVSLREGAHAIVASLPSAPPPFSSAPAAPFSAPSSGHGKMQDVVIAVTPAAAAAAAAAAGMAGHSGNPADGTLPDGGGVAGPGLGAAGAVPNRVHAPHSYYNRQHGNTRGPIGQNYSKKPGYSSGYMVHQDPRVTAAPAAPDGQYSLYGNEHYANA